MNYVYPKLIVLIRNPRPADSSDQRSLVLVFIEYIFYKKLNHNVTQKAENIRLVLEFLLGKTDDDFKNL